MEPWSVAFVILGVVGVAALIGAPAGSLRTDSPPTSAAVRPEPSVLRDEPVPAPQLDTKKPVATVPAVRMRTTSAPTVTTSKAESVKTPAVDARVKTVSTPTGESAKTPAVETRVNAEPTAHAEGQASALVTIQGCLKGEDDTFWLKDTSGEDAPTSRSWKSGFLKKRSASVEVVDATSTLKLTQYVGQRVAATGTITDRRMQARSLQRVAVSCN